MFRRCELCISVAECLDVYQESLNEIEMKIVTQMVAYVLIHPAMMEDYSTASCCVSRSEREEDSTGTRALFANEGGKKNNLFLTVLLCLKKTAE